MGYQNQVQAIGSSPMTDNSVKYSEFASETAPRPIVQKNNYLNTQFVQSAYETTKSRHVSQTQMDGNPFAGSGQMGLFQWNYNAEKTFGAEATGMMTGNYSTNPNTGETEMIKRGMNLQLFG